jgi:hypothetical protein
MNSDIHPTSTTTIIEKHATMSNNHIKSLTARASMNGKPLQSKGISIDRKTSNNITQPSDVNSNGSDYYIESQPSVLNTDRVLDCLY